MCSAGWLLVAAELLRLAQAVERAHIARGEPAGAPPARRPGKKWRVHSAVRGWPHWSTSVNKPPLISSTPQTIIAIIIGLEVLLIAITRSSCALWLVGNSLSTKPKRNNSPPLSSNLAATKLTCRPTPCYLGISVSVTLRIRQPYDNARNRPNYDREYDRHYAQVVVLEDEASV